MITRGGITFLEPGDDGWDEGVDPCWPEYDDDWAADWTEWRTVQAARLPVVDGDQELAGILDEALDQAQSGKGKERHGADGQEWDDQPIIQFCEHLGSNDGARFQAMKKIVESARLPPERARQELLGAISYCAAAIRMIDRKTSREG